MLRDIPGPRQLLAQDGEGWPSMVWYNFWRELALLTDVAGEAAPVGFYARSAINADAPGWMVTDGRAISRTDFAALFAAIGTTYGPGDGVNTFNIPGDPGDMAGGHRLIRVTR